MNSKVSISKPNEPSIMSRTRSAILPTSIIELRSFPTSMNVNRRVLPLTTVTGPRISLSECLVYRLISDFIKVDFPTPGGPAIAMTIGAGGGGSLAVSTGSGLPSGPSCAITFLSAGVRLTSGTCSRFWSFSAVRRACKLAVRKDDEVKAYSPLSALSATEAQRHSPFH
jgi:hypothetical protein